MNSIPVSETYKFSYENTKKRINAIINTYKKGLYSTSITMHEINKACSNYTETDKAYSFDDIISRRNSLYKYSITKLSKAITYIEKGN